MTVETFIESLTRSEKLLAMELIWRELSYSENAIESPEWHDEVVRKRLQSPAPGESLGLQESLEEIQGRRNASKNST